jgi:hypothetical protein
MDKILTKQNPLNQTWYFHRDGVILNYGLIYIFCIAWNDIIVIEKDLIFFKLIEFFSQDNKSYIRNQIILDNAVL